MLWLIPPEEQVEHTSDDAPFAPLTRDEMAKRLLAELPQGFEVHPTTHYLIFYDTSPAYAQWCGSLFERLYMAFTNFWTRKGFELTEPEFPLVAVVFADKQSYLKFSRPELGEAGESIIGYFGLTTNRMTMYDLTGVEAQGHGRIEHDGPDQPDSGPARGPADRGDDRPRGDAPDRLQLRAAHAAERLPALVQRGDRHVFRDARPAQRQRVGAASASVNQPRLEQFQRVPGDPAGRLAGNADPRRQAVPRPEAGAGRLRRGLGLDLLPHPASIRRSTSRILRMLSAKKPLVQDGPEQRLDEFRQAFGELPKLDAEFLRYMARAAIAVCVRSIAFGRGNLLERHMAFAR